jgi:hypothetical protein
MASFAEIDDNNIVLRVLVVPNEEEHRGQDYLANEIGLGGTWIQTSYNTTSGVHRLGGTPLRKNHASPGFSYDPDRDAFIPEKIYDSWILNEETCNWESPIPHPNDGNQYIWDEESQSWLDLEV